MAWQDDARRLGVLFANTRRLLFITGAGLGADSGLPTYRGIGGLYDTKHTDDGLPIEEALSGPMLARDPAIPWRYLRQLEASVRGARFNRGHEVIAALQGDGRTVTVLTQNVDGFHTAAGSRDVIEIHGNFQRIRCLSCPFRTRVDDYRGFGDVPVPRCPECSGTLRPEVVLFGEMLPYDALRRLQAVLEGGVDLIVSVGTTSVFPYIAGPIVEASELGIPTVEVNPGETAVSSLVDVRIRHGAAEALDLAYRHFRGP